MYSHSKEHKNYIEHCWLILNFSYGNESIPGWGNKEINFFYKIGEDSFLNNECDLFPLSVVELAAISRKIESDEESSGVSELDHSSDDFVPSSSECESIDDGESSGSSDSDDSTKPTPIQERISKLHKDGLGRKKPVDVDFPYVSIRGRPPLFDVFSASIVLT